MLTFTDLSASWDSVISPIGEYPLHMEEIIAHIEENIKPSGINSHAVTVVDVRTRKYLYVDERIEQVTGYTREEYLDKGPKFLFSKIPLSHKFGVLKSTLHQNKFISSIGAKESRDVVLFREYNVFDRKGNPRRILHQILDHVFDPTQKVKAVISLQTNIEHISSATKFKYYIYSKSQNAIIYPKATKIKSDFTPREKEIIFLISEGLTSTQIAQRLYLSIHTIKTHRKNILKKSNASNFFELINSLNS